MIRLFIAFMLLSIPLYVSGQSVWERPADKQDKQEIDLQQKTEKKQASRKDKIALKNKQQPNDTNQESKPVLTPDMKDYKYLVKGAVPVNEKGLVVFTKDFFVKGMPAQNIYEKVYAALDTLSQTSCIIKGGIALVNKKEHSIAGQYTEWMTFKRTFINLDRTKFSYTLIARCTDSHLHISLERISYTYEEDRPTAMRTTAEKWVTDKYAVNKKGTKLLPNSAKFRRATIDRVAEIFKMIEKSLH